VKVPRLGAESQWRVFSVMIDPKVGMRRNYVRSSCTTHYNGTRAAGRRHVASFTGYQSEKCLIYSETDYHRYLVTHSKETRRTKLELNLNTNIHSDNRKEMFEMFLRRFLGRGKTIFWALEINIPRKVLKWTDFRVNGSPGSVRRRIWTVP